jgi:hypothetical protein
MSGGNRYHQFNNVKGATSLAYVSGRLPLNDPPTARWWYFFAVQG